ncbi:hypothetical protein BDW72DRAFT_193071 [Aspergillus terricola var. indicus]
METTAKLQRASLGAQPDGDGWKQEHQEPKSDLVDEAVGLGDLVMEGAGSPVAIVWGFDSGVWGYFSCLRCSTCSLPGRLALRHRQLPPLFQHQDRDTRHRYLSSGIISRPLSTFSWYVAVSGLRSRTYFHSVAAPLAQISQIPIS